MISNNSINHPWLCPCQVMCATHREHQDLFDKARAEQDELRAQLQTKSAELDAILNGKESEGKLLADLRGQLQQAQEQVQLLNDLRPQVCSPSGVC